MKTETIPAYDQSTGELTSYKKTTMSSNPLIIGIGATNIEAITDAIYQFANTLIKYNEPIPAS